MIGTARGTARTRLGVPTLGSVVGLLVSASIGSSLAAQVTTQPRDMGLPTPASVRPDPGSHRFVLDNGLVTYHAQDGSAPLVTITAFVGSGHVDGTEGAAEVVAHGLQSAGPAGMGSGAFHQALRDMAADYRVVLGPERTEITLDVPAEDALHAVALLAALVVRGPEIGDEALDYVRARASRSAGGNPSAASALYEGSMGAAMELFQTQILGTTSYGHVPSLDQLDALRPSHAQSFHERFFVTGNVTLSVAGAIDRNALRGALESGFADLRSGRRHGRSDVGPPSPANGRRIFTYPADKLQGWLVIGHELPVVPLEDQAPLEVMNYILGGGHFDTRLFRATRDRRGLTNDDSGYLEHSSNGPGTYSFHTSGRPEAVRLLLHLTLEEIERIRAERVTEEELFVAKGALADGVFAAGYRDGWSAARTLALEWSEHRSHDRSASYQRRIGAVTADDVLRAARTYLSPDRMQAVLVGPIEAIEAAPALETEGTLSDYGEVVRGR